jgi:virginiamycin A acetyltransferase
LTLIIDESANISKLADIEDSVRGSIITISANCMIDSFVKIKPVGGKGNFYIGENSHINSGCVLYTGNGILIGKNVLIAANCTFAAGNHAYKDKEKLIKDQGFMDTKGGIVIKDDVWIGSNSILLDGTVIERGCVVAAGSIVRGHLEEFGIYGGLSATLIGFR